MCPVRGLLARLSGRFFSKQRVISPIRGFFIGIFPPILQMQLLIIIYPENQEIVDVVNTVGLPLVLSNSIGIAIFTAMIGIIEIGRASCRERVEIWVVAGSVYEKRVEKRV